MAAVWSLITDLDVAGVIDDVVGARRSDAGASVGTYLALAALGRLVAPRSKKAFADWLATTAGDRFTPIRRKVLDHRKFWDAMHSVDIPMRCRTSARLAARMIEMFDLDTSSVALDMTNFATYIDTTNSKAPIAQRGKAKQNAPICAWSGWGWSSPGPEGSRWSGTPTPGTGPTSPSSRP